MTSLKTSIKTITYLSDIGCLEIQGASLALLQRLANEELARAEYDEQIRAKVAAARADKRPGMSSAQLRQQLQGRYQELRNEL